MRRKGRPEEGVFERFSERFGAPAPHTAPRKRETRQGPREDPHRESQRESPRDTPPPTPVAPPSPALGVLGLGTGASKAEVAAAYRRMARTYHPDKVAGESQEVREFAEERMKEINAAHAQLKRRWNGPATEGAKAG